MLEEEQEPDKVPHCLFSHLVNSAVEPTRKYLASTQLINQPVSKSAIGTCDYVHNVCSGVPSEPE